jgi:D-alanyl-D-alanine carboxypeptidase (penicillin-binding protein 5/6)
MSGMRLTPASGATRAAVAAVAALVVIAVLALAPGRARAIAPPQLSSGAAILVDADGGQKLFGQNPNSRRAIASTTKLMTALITLEHVHHLGRMFTQNDYVSAAEDSQIGLVPGERMSVHDLMLAMLLPSADDAAEDLAYNVGHGSVARFVGMMNAKARELGLNHTHYSTPIGLDTPGNYSSASDLAKLARYVMQSSPFFRRAVGLPSAVLHTGRHVRVVDNRNDLVGRYHWINGVKTGHTNAAGYVLVGSGTRNGMTLVSAVLGTPSEDARDDSTLALLDWGFDHFLTRTPVHAGQVLARPTVKGRKGMHARLVADLTYAHVFAKGAHVHLRVTAPQQLDGPLERDAVVGSVAVMDGRKLVRRIPLVLAAAVPAPAPVTSALDFITRPFTLVVVVVLIAAVIGLAIFRRARVRGRRAEPA